MITADRGADRGAQIRRAIGAGVAFLAARQHSNGEIPIVFSARRDMNGELTVDPSVFPTALALHALGFLPEAAAIRRRAAAFLLAQREEPGVWRHRARDHAGYHRLPPDVDDTACASAALEREGMAGAADARILLANRAGSGLFYTWIVPRLRWPRGPHGRFVLGQLRQLPALYTFFRSYSAQWRDIDAVVNANCLFALGRFPGHEPVVAHLLGVLRTGTEASCDKWYDSPFAVWYFFARALSATAPHARELMLERISSATPSSTLEIALSTASALYWGVAPEETTIDRLLAEQRDSGAWARAALYDGGRARQHDGTIDESSSAMPYWGSEELTTAFCLEALARLLQLKEGQDPLDHGDRAR
jgi:hypothetical protein